MLHAQATFVLDSPDLCWHCAQFHMKCILLQFKLMSFYVDCCISVDDFVSIVDFSILLCYAVQFWKLTICIYVIFLLAAQYMTIVRERYPLCEGNFLSKLVLNIVLIVEEILVQKVSPKIVHTKVNYAPNYKVIWMGLTNSYTHRI